MSERKEAFKKQHPNVTAREMPNNYEAECALLGCFLIDSKVAVEYLTQLSPDDFYMPQHRAIAESMKELLTRTMPTDLVTVVQQLETMGELELCGGVDYLARLVDVTPSAANAEYYYKIVKKDAQLRAVITIARQMADTAYSLDPEDNALEQAEAALYALAENSTRTKPKLITGYIEEALNDFKQRQNNRNAYLGVPTGFAGLDKMLGGGFQKSDLIILAARPGQGKTSFAMNCAVNAALAKRPDTKKPYSVAVFSLEMSAVQLAKRILCSVGTFDMSKANRADINEMEWAKLYDAERRLAGTSLYIDESGSATPAEILSKCRQLKRQQGLDLIMIDYLQLMHSGKRIDNVVQEIAEITRSLKLTAKELNVPVLLLSQMSRDIDKRKDPTPQLSDLRDSGAIEQDADIVFFLDRNIKPDAKVEDPSAHSPDTRLPGNTVYLNIAKHRNGETGSVRLVWIPSSVTFKSVDKIEEPRAHMGLRKNAFIDGSDEPPFELSDGAPGDDSGAMDEEPYIDDDIGLLD